MLFINSAIFFLPKTKKLLFQKFRWFFFCGIHCVIFANVVWKWVTKEISEVCLKLSLSQWSYLPSNIVIIWICRLFFPFLKSVTTVGFFSNLVLLHSAFIALFDEDNVVTLFIPSLMHLSHFLPAKRKGNLTCDGF